MTDNEIIKALEWCNSLSKRCGNGCPYYKVPHKDGKRCSEMMIDDTLDLINRLKAENERYREVVGKLAVGEDGTVTGFVNGKETKFINKEVAETFKRFAVSEVRKEFAERLKDKAEKTTWISGGELVEAEYKISREDLDDILAEMEERE